MIVWLRLRDALARPSWRCAALALRMIYVDGVLPAGTSFGSRVGRVQPDAVVPVVLPGRHGREPTGRGAGRSAIDRPPPRPRRGVANGRPRAARQLAVRGRRRADRSSWSAATAIGDQRAMFVWPLGARPRSWHGGGGGGARPVTRRRGTAARPRQDAARATSATARICSTRSSGGRHIVRSCRWADGGNRDVRRDAPLLAFVVHRLIEVPAGRAIRSTSGRGLRGPASFPCRRPGSPPDRPDPGGPSKVLR